MHVDLAGLRALVRVRPKASDAVAKTLAANGAEVAVNGRKPAEVDAAIAKIRASGRKRASLPPRRHSDRGGRRRRDRGSRRCRYPGEQCRYLRAQGCVRHSRRGLAAPVCDQRALGRAPDPALRAAHARQRVRPRRFHLLGIRRADPDRDDPLRLHQIRRSRLDARVRASARGDRRYRQRGIPGPTRTEGVEAMFRSMGKRWTIRTQNASSSKAAGQARSSSAWRGPRKWPTSWSFSVRARQAPITGSPVRADGGIVMSIT